MTRTGVSSESLSENSDIEKKKESKIVLYAILGYSIYKSHYVLEQKTKAIYVYSLFVRELWSRLNVCKNIYSSVLFNKIQKCIEK